MARSSFSLFYMKVSFILRLLTVNRRMTLKQINQKWKHNLHGDSHVISTKCFERYRNSIAEIFGVEILQVPIQGGYYYTIENIEDLSSNDILLWSLNALSMGETLMDAKALHNRIIMEGFPSENGHLTTVVDAMKKNIKLNLVYRKYGFTDEIKHTLDIYCMIQYHQRLYIVGKTEYGWITTFSLDRVISMEQTGETFDTPSDFDVHEYFKNAYGVMVNENKWPPQKVVLRAYDDEPNYLRDVPIHKSQRELSSGNGYCDFEYFISTTNDFIGKILEQGDRLQVISPQPLVDEVRRRIDNASRRYTDPNKD